MDLAVRCVTGLRELADRYDGFVIDQWGVLHDGRAAYPGAVHCMRRLKELGKFTLILSNSGKRASANEARLRGLGFERDSYSQLITSGDVAWASLKTRTEPFYRKLKSRCLLISNDGDESVVEGLALDLVSDIQTADFVLLAGLGHLDMQRDWDFLLASALERRLPVLCANPDVIRLANGGAAPGCGALALSYERLGGEVHYVGKPYHQVYEYCREFFDRRSIGRVVAIGDSLEHDVAGGNAAGFDTAFISDGIHCSHFAFSRDDNDKRARIAELIGAHKNRRPTWVLSSLCW